MRQQIKFNEQKFKELLLYIADKCENDPLFGAVKLNKILYLADNIAYAETGTPISGADYEASELGPAPTLLLPIRDDMAANGDLVVRQRSRFGYLQHRVTPLREPDLSLFSGQEIAIVDMVIDLCSGGTGRDLTELTHGMYGWKVAEYRETIPYSAFFLCAAPPTKADVERAHELASQLEWGVLNE